MAKASFRYAAALAGVLLLCCVVLALAAQTPQQFPLDSPTATLTAFYQAVASGVCGDALALRPGYSRKRCQAMGHAAVEQARVVCQTPQTAVLHITVRYALKDGAEQRFRGHVTLRRTDRGWEILNRSYHRDSTTPARQYLQQVAGLDPVCATQMESLPPQKGEADASLQSADSLEALQKAAAQALQELGAQKSQKAKPAAPATSAAQRPQASPKSQEQPEPPPPKLPKPEADRPQKPAGADTVPRPAAVQAPGAQGNDEPATAATDASTPESEAGRKSSDQAADDAAFGVADERPAGQAPNQAPEQAAEKAAEQAAGQEQASAGAAQADDASKEGEPLPPSGFVQVRQNLQGDYYRPPQSFGSVHVLRACYTPASLSGISSEAQVTRLPEPDRIPPVRQQAEQALPPVSEPYRGSIRRIAPAIDIKPVALTFDLCEAAQERSGYDAAIVDYLRQHAVPATFYAGGKWMRSHEDRAKQLIADPLFEVGNHAWSHGNLRKLSGRRMRNQILWTQGQYEALWLELNQCALEKGLPAAEVHKIPAMPLTFRFPYGECSAESLQAAAEFGLPAVQWDVVSGDPDKSVTAQAMAQDIKSRTRPGSIIICHANGRGHNTAEALPLFVPWLREQGFDFVTVSQLLQLGRPETMDRCVP